VDQVVIREVRVEDAEAYNVYRRQMADEPDNFIDYSEGQYTRSVDEERELLRATLAKSIRQSLVAEVNGMIVGACSCVGTDNRSLRHTVGLGIGILPDYRHQGLGSQFMEQILSWAKAHSIVRRIEFDVFATNHRAIGLYLKYGFKVEGRKEKVYFKYGHYIDAYLMALCW